MNLVHGSPSNKNQLLKILKSKYLKPSKETKNLALYGPKGTKGSDFIFLMIESAKHKLIPPYHSQVKFYFNPKLLRERTFYVNDCWQGEKCEESVKYEGDKLTLIQLVKILKKIIKNTLKNIKKRKKDTEFKFVIDIHSHEILITGKIHLEKYLTKISLAGYSEKDTKSIKEYITKSYPHVKVQTRKIESK